MTPSKDCLVYCRDHNFKAGGGGVLPQETHANSALFAWILQDPTKEYFCPQKGQLLLNSSLNASLRVSVVSSNYKQHSFCDTSG